MGQLVAVLDGGTQFFSRHFRHHDIAEDDIGMLFEGNGQPFFSVTGCEHIVNRGKEVAEHLQHLDVVFFRVYFLVVDPQRGKIEVAFGLFDVDVFFFERHQSVYTAYEDFSVLADVYFAADVDGGNGHVVFQSDKLRFANTFAVKKCLVGVSFIFFVKKITFSDGLALLLFLVSFASFVFF